MREMLVDVALATYNGALFLPELLQSLQNQTQSGLRIIASDDGSKDDTLVLLAAASGATQILVAPARPRGNIMRNFENALLFTTAPYVALSDQDDVWDPRKIEKLLAAVQAIESRLGPDVPALAFCDLEIVDRSLGMISPSFFAATLKSSQALEFEDYVLNSHVPGCAMLMNRALLEKSLPFPTVSIHDHWLIQIATLFGEVSYVDEVLIKYRQHGSNNIGLGDAGRTPTEKMKARITSVPKQILRRVAKWRQQARAIRQNIDSIYERYAPELAGSPQLTLITAVRARDGKAMRRSLAKARTGERGIDKQGLIWALSRID